MDFLFFSEAKGRKYPWNKVSKLKLFLFILCTATIIPLLIQSIIGFCRKPDFSAWAFHIIACWITLWVYGWGVVRGVFKKEAANRDDWKQ